MSGNPEKSQVIELHAKPRQNPRGVRPMEPGDLQAVARLFNKVFRKKDAEPDGDLLAYLDRVFLKSPRFSPKAGSIIHENAKGQIDSALLALPMPFQIAGRPVTARLLCAFMADGKTGMVGAAQLARAIRVSQPDLCFSDNASPVSADHWTTAGGAVLPVLSLEWRRVFRPFRVGVGRLKRKLPAFRHLPAEWLTGPADFLVRRKFSTFTPSSPPGLRSVHARPDEFLRCAEEMTERFTIRPAWSQEDLTWLMETASLNRTLGTLCCRTVVNAKDEVIGCYLFFGKPRGTANVLNLLCREGREFDVSGQMFADFNALGYAAAQGVAQPFLMNALMRQRQMSFKHRGYFCMLTSHQDVNDAALRGDIFVGGLASESWSRLLTDFQ